MPSLVCVLLTKLMTTFRWCPCRLWTSDRTGPKAPRPCLPDKLTARVWWSQQAPGQHRKGWVNEKVVQTARESWTECHPAGRLCQEPAPAMNARGLQPLSWPGSALGRGKHLDLGMHVPCGNSYPEQPPLTWLSRWAEAHLPSPTTGDGVHPRCLQRPEFGPPVPAVLLPHFLPYAFF